MSFSTKVGLFPRQRSAASDLIVSGPRTSAASGWVYLAVILDARSCKAVGHANSCSIDTQLTHAGSGAGDSTLPNAVETASCRHAQ